MLLRRFLATVTAIAVGPGSLLVGLLAAPASAATTAPDYEMPFPCGSTWTGSTRSTHRPSSYSIDFNRANDLGALLVATAPGRVYRVADTGRTSYGKYVILDHGGGRSSLYAHLKSVWVTSGQQVDQGTTLGLVGESGGVSSAHLHFEERLNGRVHHPYFHRANYSFGRTSASLNCPDVPLAGDWNGDRIDDVTMFRRARGYGTFIQKVPGGITKVPFGRSSDTPVTGDWDGDGRSDVGVRRPGRRLFLLRNESGSTSSVRMGRVSDVPVTGDWDGDGDTEVGIFRPRVASFRMLVAPGVMKAVRLGSTGSIPVTGDWNGDKITDLGTFDPATATFTLRSAKAGATPVVSTVRFGTTTDLPVSGDWNGDGRGDIGVWSPGSATYSLRTTPVTSRTTRTVITKRYGLPRR